MSHPFLVHRLQVCPSTYVHTSNAYLLKKEVKRFSQLHTGYNSYIHKEITKSSLITDLIWLIHKAYIFRSEQFLDLENPSTGFIHWLCRKH